MSDRFEPAQPLPALDEAGVQRLRLLLKQQAVSAGGMSLEMVDGLFSALQVAPADCASSEWLPLVLGSGEWNAADRAEAVTLLARLWHHVGERIEIDPDSDPGTYMPLLSFPSALPESEAELAEALVRWEFPLGAAWAGGFLHAVHLRLPDWQALQQRIPALQTSFGHLLRLIQLDTDSDGSKAPTGAERVALLTAVPYLLRALRATRRERLAADSGVSP